MPEPSAGSLVATAIITILEAGCRIGPHGTGDQTLEDRHKPASRWGCPGVVLVNQHPEEFLLKKARTSACLSPVHPGGRAESERMALLRSLV